MVQFCEPPAGVSRTLVGKHTNFTIMAMQTVRMMTVGMRVVIKARRDGHDGQSLNPETSVPSVEEFLETLMLMPPSCKMISSSLEEALGSVRGEKPLSGGGNLARCGMSVDSV